MRKGHMQYHWWKYAAVLAVSVALWCGVFYNLAQPEDHERLHILFVGEGLDTAQMQSDIEKLLPKLTEQNMKQVKVTQSDLQGQSALQILQARFYEYDIVLISNRCMQQNMGGAVFYQAMKPALSGRFSDYEFYAEISDDSAALYGVQMKQGTGAFYQYWDKDEPCYCFPSPNSVNFDGLNGLGEKGNDCALRIMEYLLGAGQEVDSK